MLCRTIFGESAGAISVCYHLAAPASANLFYAAIMESGFCTGIPLSKGENISLNVTVTLGCTQSDYATQLKCLRNISPTSVLEANINAGWWFVIDSYELTQDPIDYLIEGNFSRVPILMGTNRNEDSLWQCPWNENLTASGYITLILEYFGEELGEAILQIYPSSIYDEPVQASIDVESDFLFVCPTRRAARAISGFGVPVYMYSFKHIPGWSTDCLRVSHTYELPFLFPTLVQRVYNFTSDELELSSRMTQYWIHFAQDQSPYYPNGFGWPPYIVPEYDNLVLDIILSIQYQYKEVQCDFWDRVTP